MSTPIHSIKIFISYAREDARDLALRLHTDLRAIGHECWIDLSEIDAGASWSQTIEDAIETCDIALALLSAGSYVSEICRAEQLRAIRKGKRVIPLMAQPDAERPLPLEHLNYLDFSNLERYEEMFRDLLSDITAGQAFRLPHTRAIKTAAPFHRGHPKSTARPYAAEEKRDARAFRRYIADLRDEAWLGSRYWWPYFLFYFADMQEVAAMLKTGALLSPALREAQTHPHRRAKRDRWDKTVRLNFRPRTPDLFSSEGLRPVDRQRPGTYCPLPVYLLFDLEAVICQMDTRFSDGDVTETNKTSKSATAFRELPFDLIYHDSWFMSDEKDEVMRHRRAQVIVNERLGLESLQYIWCRSSAEYDTLRSLLPAETWQAWRDKITARTDYNLFLRKWAYVENAILSPAEVRFRFNPCETRADCGMFAARVEVETPDGKRFRWREEDFMLGDDLLVDVSDLGKPERYTVRLYLNDDLAYAGHYNGESEVL